MIYMSEENLVEEICNLVKEYTCMEMGYLFRYDLKKLLKEYYEDNYSDSERDYD